MAETEEKPQIIFTFDRDNNTHSLRINGASGKEMLLAYQSLGDDIKEKAGMDPDMALVMASMVQEKEKQEEGK